MQQTAGNVTQAARLAKRNRTDFYNLLARYRLHPEDFKGGEKGGDQAVRKSAEQRSAGDAHGAQPGAGSGEESDAQAE
jgi:hypothetical protein